MLEVKYTPDHRLLLIISTFNIFQVVCWEHSGPVVFVKTLSGRSYLVVCLLLMQTPVLFLNVNKVQLTTLVLPGFLVFGH